MYMYIGVVRTSKDDLFAKSPSIEKSLKVSSMSSLRGYSFHCCATVAVIAVVVVGFVASVAAS